MSMVCGGLYWQGEADVAGKSASRNDNAAATVFPVLNHHTLHPMTKQHYKLLEQAVELLWYVFNSSMVCGGAR
jgi:hypothetical protein